MNVQLVLFKEDGTRRDFEVKRESVVIGRSGDCDLQIPLAVISRRHCKVSKKGDRVIVKDLGSSNGTFLNDKRVLQGEAKAGDQMKIGPVVFTVVIDGTPAEVKPVITVLSSKAEASPSDPKTEVADVAPAAAIPEAGSEAPPENNNGEHASGDNAGGIEIVADLDNLTLDESKADAVDDAVDLDETGLSPLAELEELSKQPKK